MKKNKGLFAFIIITMMIVSGISSITYGNGLSPPKSSPLPLITEEDSSKTVMEKTYENSSEDIKLPELPLITEGDSSETVTEETYEEPNPSITVSIESCEDSYKIGEDIEYSVIITNDGNVDLANVLVQDKLGTINERVYILSSGERKIITGKTYIGLNIVLNELQDGKIINTVYAEGQYEDAFVRDEDTISVKLRGPEEIQEDVSNEYFKEEKMYEELPPEFYEYFNRQERKTSLATFSNSMLMEARELTATTYEDTIEVDKTATAVEGCREYEVTLDITGTPPEVPIDVILVIDRSGSMDSGDPTSMYYAKEAAKDFAEQVLENPNNRVGIVSYAYSGEWHWIIPLIWGYYDDGDLYDDTSINSNFSNNITQVKSAIDGIQPEGGTNTEAGFIRAKNLMISYGRPEANKAIVLLTDGVPTVSIDRTYGPSEPISHNAHTIAAYEAGQSAQEIARVFTVGLFNDIPDECLDVARDTLQRAQDAGYYETFEAANLSGIYHSIEDELGYSATNAVVTDVISDDFALITDFSTNPDVDYDESTNTITWTPGTIVDEESLTYRIRAKCSFEGGEGVSTNDWAKLNYKDVNGNNSEKEFPIPTVYVQAPLTIELGPDREIIIEDSIGLGCDLTVSSGYPPYTYTWTSSTDPDWISHEANPQVSPREDTVYTLVVNDKYGSETCGACSDTDEIFIKVIKGSITINKIVQNENTDKTFPVWISGEGKTWAILIKNEQHITINNLRPGTYQIKEVVPMNYSLVGISPGTVNITRDNLNKNVTINNKRKYNGWFTDEEEVDNHFTVRLE